MFVGTSKNTTFVMCFCFLQTLYLCISPAATERKQNGGLLWLTQGCIYAKRADRHQSWAGPLVWRDCL